MLILFYTGEYKNRSWLHIYGTLNYILNFEMMICLVEPEVGLETHTAT